jgi:hypothetical protein
MKRRPKKDLTHDYFYVCSLRGKLEDKLQEVINAYRAYNSGEEITNIDKYLCMEQANLLKQGREKEALLLVFDRLVEEKEMVPIICENFNFPSYYINKKGEILKSSYIGETLKSFKMIATFINGAGYKCFSFCSKGSDKRVYLHRVLASMFIHNSDPDKKEQVNHIDLNRSNNDLDNLEWVTPLENMQHAVAAHGKPLRGSKLSISQIREIKRVVRTKEKPLTQHFEEQAEKHGISSGYASQIFYGAADPTPSDSLQTISTTSQSGKGRGQPIGKSLSRTTLEAMAKRPRRPTRPTK